MKIRTAMLLLALPMPAAAGVCTSGHEVLKCYHPTARYQRCEESISGPATIYFQGVSGKPYQMDVKLHTRQGFYRVEVLRDTALLPPNRGCPLDNWNPASGH